MFHALQRRSARAVGDLDALPRPEAIPPLTVDTTLVHAEGAISHLTGSPETIDFAYPGGHLYIHRGAQEAVIFIADTPRFRVRDIPAPDDVRLALAARLIEVGFLRAL
jgi:hypothetical protein